MKTYKVDYISLEDELCEGIVEAWTKEDAEVYLADMKLKLKYYIDFATKETAK